MRREEIKAHGWENSGPDRRPPAAEDFLSAPR
jgi:hypothetical protein